MSVSFGSRPTFWDRVVAILPLVTLGLGACLPSIWRAARNGFPKFYALAVAYGVASLVCLVVSTIPGWDNTVTTIGAGGLVLLAVTSSCQALAWSPPSQLLTGGTTGSGDEDPVAAGRAVVKRRREARHIAENDPELASVLKIGRPGVERTYFDGGLIDLNHAEVKEIQTACGIPEDLAAEIVSAREAIGAFSSVNDLGSVLSIDPRELDLLRPLALFL